MRGYREISVGIELMGMVREVAHTRRAKQSPSVSLDIISLNLSQ